MGSQQTRAALLGDLSGRVAYAAKASRALLADPPEGLERVRERLSRRREEKRAPYPYKADTDWHEKVHELLALDWPCRMDVEFSRLWHELVAEMASRRLVLGRGTFGGWDDAGPGLARAVYCLTRHLQPRTVVETGVAHGVTTRFILEALERNRRGALWSIDLPPLTETSLHAEIAVAVHDRLRARWTLCVGSSRRRLPGLLRDLGAFDLFVHDSMHTERNMRFELDRAWRALGDTGVILADDIDFNRAFALFAGTTPGSYSLVADHDDRRRLFGIVVKRVIPASPLPASVTRSAGFSP